MRKVLLFMAILLLAFGDVLGQAGRIRPPGKYMTGEPKVARKIYVLAVFQDGQWNEPVVQVIDNRRGKQAQKQDIRNASLLAEIRNLLSGFVPVSDTVVSVYDGGGLQRVSREIGQAVYRILGGKAADEVLVRLRIKDPVEGDTWYSYLSIWQNVTGQVAGIKSSRIMGLVRERNEVHMIVYYTPRTNDRLYVGEEVGYLPSPPAMGEFHASSIYVFLMRQMPDGEVQELERETFTHNGEYDGRGEDFINRWVRSYYWQKKQNYRSSLTGGFVYFVRPPEVNLQEFGVSDRRLIWKRIDRVCDDGRVIGSTLQVEKYENNYTYSYNGIVQEADVYDFREVNGNLENTYMGRQELARSDQAGTYSFNKAVAGITAEQAQENVINPGIGRHDLMSVQRIRELGANYVADLRNVYNVERVQEVCRR